MAKMLFLCSGQRERSVEDLRVLKRNGTRGVPLAGELRGRKVKKKKTGT